MSDDTYLPLDATTGALVERIVEVQARARNHKADAVRLAATVVAQLDRARSCANVLEVELVHLRPSGRFWDQPGASAPMETVTLVTVSSGGIRVERGYVPAGTWNARLELALYADGGPRG